MSRGYIQDEGDDFKPQFPFTHPPPLDLPTCRPRRRFLYIARTHASRFITLAHGGYCLSRNGLRTCTHRCDARIFSAALAAGKLEIIWRSTEPRTSSSSSSLSLFFFPRRHARFARLCRLKLFTSLNTTSDIFFLLFKFVDHSVYSRLIHSWERSSAVCKD